MQQRILACPEANRGFREWGKVWFEERYWRYQSMLTTEGEPMIIRQAKAFAKVLENCTIKVESGEPIWGTKVTKLPEQPLNKEIDAYWQGRFENHIFLENLSEADRLARDNCLVLTGARHYALDFGWVLENGLEKLIAAAQTKQAAATTATQQDFYASILIVYEAYRTYIERYREYIDTKVLIRPPGSFQEALQAVWLLYMWAPDGFGRFDQYLWPYLEADLSRGSVTLSKAKEVLKAFWLKVTELVGVHNYSIFNLTLGGKRPDGQDGANPLTRLCLEVAKELKLINPGLSLRIHSGTDAELWQSAVELLRCGTGNPSFYNDDLIVPMLRSLGVTEADAQDYALTGCAELTIPGRANFWSGAGYVNMLKCVELASNNGFSFLDGYRLGTSTGKPESFTNFSQLMEAVKSQVRHANQILTRMLNQRDEIAAQVSLSPQLSAFMRDPAALGKDFIAGGTRYNGTQSSGLGLANAADALRAIKKVVFEDKTLTLPEFVGILKRDYQGQEALRHYILNHVPKFGNDQDEVDELAAELGNLFLEDLQNYSTPRGGTHLGGAISWFSYKTLGNKTGASADGRKSRQFLAESMDAASGQDRNGPTAVLNSALKLKHSLAPGTLVTSLKLTPKILEGTHGLNIFKALVQVYFAKGGTMLQVNLLDRATLIAAQKDPSKFQNLIVRVAGFSAYFVTLSKDVQEDLIARASS